MKIIKLLMIFNLFGSVLHADEEISLLEENIFIPKAVDPYTPIILDSLLNAVAKTITEISSDGSEVRLGDGSCWYPFYSTGRNEVVKQWNIGDKVSIVYKNFAFICPITIHNITQGLSVYGLRMYPAKPDAAEVVKVTAIDSEQHILQTSAGTEISVVEYSEEWNEICVDDEIMLMLIAPKKGLPDGSLVALVLERLGILSLNATQRPIQ